MGLGVVLCEGILNRNKMHIGSIDNVSRILRQ